MKKIENTEEIGWKFLLSARWYGYYALIVVFSIACVFLGNWQFDRRDQARAEIQRIDTNYEAAAVPLDEALPTTDSFDNDANKWLPVTVSGEYVGEPYLARNRVSSEGVGALLIQPLQLADGTIFFVDRGWVNFSATDKEDFSFASPPAGLVEVTARLRQSETQLKNRENSGQTLGSLDMKVLAEQMGVKAYTGAYGQLISENPAGETGLLPPKPERDEGPHLSYALQWYVFILIVLGGAWYAASLEYKSLNAQTAEEREQRRKRKEKRRRLSDAEEEDLFLDGF